MALETVTMWLVVGSVAGLLAGVIVDGYGISPLGNVAIGILGAIIVGALFARSGVFGERNIGGVVVSGTIGATAMLLLLRYFPRK